MKICTKCKIKKSIGEFNKRSSSKDGHSSYCRECNKLSLKSHYKKNKNKYLKRNREKKENLKKEFKSFKESLSCIKCGEKRHWVLDFHHRESDKKDGYISKLFFDNGKDKLKRELEKCDVVCANCHRDIHYKEKN